MADTYSTVDEGFDLGSGLNDALGCGFAAIFYIGALISLPLFMTASVFFFVL